MERVRDSYDTVAERYADELADELEGKPLERALLRCFAELTAHVDGVVADVGCGPGHVTHHLAELGCEVVGIDLSPRMVNEARKRFPGHSFDVGSMLELPPDAKWAGAVAFYSIIHMAPEQRRAAFQELARAIRPEGVLLLGFHVSDDEHTPGKSKYLEKWWGESVDITAHFLEPVEVVEELAVAGFSVTTRVEREPRSGEYPSRRCYLIAVR
jgi:ubiquinone/menaquinone biosynthesis C-methylase UbiE